MFPFSSFIDQPEAPTHGLREARLKRSHSESTDLPHYFANHSTSHSQHNTNFWTNNATKHFAAPRSERPGRPGASNVAIALPPHSPFHISYTNSTDALDSTSKVIQKPRKPQASLKVGEKSAHASVWAWRRSQHSMAHSINYYWAHHPPPKRGDNWVLATIPPVVYRTGK